MKLIPTGSQTVGPYLHVGLTWLTTQDIAGTAGGRRIRISGRITDADGVAVPDALVEVWQANPQGKYAHPADKQDKPVDSAFKGWGAAPRTRMACSSSPR